MLIVVCATTIHNYIMYTDTATVQILPRLNGLQ